MSAASHHPLDPLSPAELTEAAGIILAHVEKEFPSQTVYFKALSLAPPLKAVLSPFLDAVAAGDAPAALPRQAEALLGVRSSAAAIEYYECFVTLAAGPNVPGVVDQLFPIDKSFHVGIDAEEMARAEAAILANEEFKAAIASLRLPEGATVVADTWIFGADSFKQNVRSIPFMIYYRLSDKTASNHYSFPLPLFPSVRASDYSLLDLGWTAIFGGESTDTIAALPAGSFPWNKLQAVEYDHQLQVAAGISLRSDIKPYRVVQPEGASFKLDGRVINWQKWQFHIGFNYREGPVISDVRYDGRLVFHRLSVSDMTVPYGDPRAPYHRKQAFDLGDVGAGLCANELNLGCDCLGEIEYLSFDLVRHNGELQRLNNVVCIHEQDEGIGWKHTNFRTGEASVTRSRVLVVQTIITVANYEYIFAWKFDQAAALHLETRATGILSTALIVPGETAPYGTVVAPGVFAPNHQHLFSVRIDPAIDGHNNTVIQEDSVAMPFDAKNPPANNLYGVGYTVEKTPITVAGFADAAPEKNRIFKIINPSKINPISGRAMGYKLVPAPSQLMLAHPDSVAYARAEFGGHHIWVTSHKDPELYSGGKYTNQSSGNAKGIRTWVDRKDNVENADLVLWHTFGLTHNPRIEDFPVMPCETHQISFKPVDFFNLSPANDVPSSTQEVNQSKLVEKKSCCA